MTRRKKTLVSATILAVAVAALFAYRYGRSRDPLAVRTEMLSLLPENANVVVFFDLAQLRSSLFLEQLLAWAPHPPPDTDYMQFVRATGFNFERDLDRVAIARVPGSPDSNFLAITEGRFDRKKIEAYATREGKREMRNGATLFAIPVNGLRPWYFTFLHGDRIAWSNDASGTLLLERRRNASEEWRERLARLAGTSFFVVIRQDFSALSALAQRAPGGFHSPQLATLLNQLQWVSISGKPDGNFLRMVIDAECFSEAIVRQLSDMLNGILVLAQAGLNSAATRRELDPQLREACLELVRSADVQKVDRGSSNSVRVIFDVTPKLLQSAHAAGAGADPPSPAGR